MSDDDAPQGSIDWATAEVKGGTLTVEIVGDPGAEWSRSLQDVVERLDRTGSAWGKVKATKARVRVESVGEGAEGDLRHLLEGAVLQVNADFAQDDEDEGGEQSEADRAMTEAFRGFAD